MTNKKSRLSAIYYYENRICLIIESKPVNVVGVCEQNQTQQQFASNLQLNTISE